MKKNNVMRIACAILILTLLSTSVISGTFAKYITDGNQASETARVAKWGVNFLGSSELFNVEYDTDDTANYADMDVSVKADTNVVAPGTEGTGYNFHVEGTPEVSYKVEFNVNDAVTQDIFLNTYFPVKYTVTLNGVATEYANLDAALTAIDAYSYYFDVTDGKYYVNGVATDAAKAMNVNLSWAWAFSTSTANDVLDTQLGDIAAGETDAIGTLVAGTDYNLQIAFDVTATATQID